MRKYLTCLLLLISSQFAFANPICEDIKARLHSDWKVGSVQVPFDWSRPDEDMMDVAFYYRDQSLFPGKVPIIFFNGGPTVSGSLAVKLFQNMHDLKDENIIILDQRGNGCSTPFKKYTGKNIDLFKHYASDSIVKDAEVIRKSFLNGMKWKIFGQSYGGLISFRYLELYPESISSAHIHGYGFSFERFMLDRREERIKEITPLVLKYSNKKVSPLTIGEMIEKIRLMSPEKQELFANTCVSTQQAIKPKLCGLDFFTGSYYVTGFRDRWSVVHKFLAEVLAHLEKGEGTLLQETYRKFVSTYILRFNDMDQAAAMNAIVYYELLEGRYLFDGCIKAKDNELVSECRFSRDYILRLDERPGFRTRAHDLDVIRDNIKRHGIEVNYYAGLFDTFLPVKTLELTAEKLGIQNTFMIFPKSGHEGFYSENQVIKNLKK